MTTAVLLILLGTLSRLLPHPPNFVALGALALYAGARLPRRYAVAAPLAAMALSDLFLDFGSGRAVFSVSRLTIYATFAAIALAGRLLSGRSSPGRLLLFSVAASALFFLTSNFAVWARGALYPSTLAGFLLCYAAAVPFFWNTLLADIAGTAVFFGLDSLARRARARQILRSGAIAALAPALLLLPSPAVGQAPPPVSDSVVVTATLTPEEERDLGSATTVITRAWIEKSGARTVADLLRAVPGVDVARQGEEGSLVSLFLRGSNSTHTLVLVNGARVNSPYFSGYDFSALTTENIERIEIVRGPFSALYGSDAIGGVIHIFTRPATARPSGRMILEAGSAGARQGSAFFSAGAGPFAAAATYRNGRVEGERVNSDWQEESGSLRLDGRIGEALRLTLEGAVVESDVGVAGPVGRPTPRARQGFREERVALPLTFHPAAGHEAGFLLAHVRSERFYEDPDSAFRADAHPVTIQARASDNFRLGIHDLTAFASWERGEVDDRSNFGVALQDESATLWGAGIQDALSLGKGFLATAGVRYDRHSDFGEALSPRGTLVWASRDALWKARASAGSAFRAPSVGELFYPFSGNPNLSPERVTSYEIGLERYLSGGRLEVSFFWNEFRNLILYDFVTSLNENVGRARTRGIELSFQQKIGDRAEIDTGYTFLDAEDRKTGKPLIRRPRHRGFLSLAWRPMPELTLSPRLIFTGRRKDADPVSGAEVENPSHVRYDVFVRYDAGLLAPYARVENIADRGYEDVRGYPAPGRRASAGIEVEF